MYINDLNNVPEGVRAEDLDLIANYDDPDSGDLTTGKLTMGELMTAYLSTQFYYGCPVMDYIETYLFGEYGVIDTIMSQYLSGWDYGEPYAMSSYLELYLPGWLSTSSDVLYLFSNSDFNSSLDYRISGFLSDDDSYAINMFSNSSYTNQLLSYVGNNIFNNDYEDPFTRNLNIWMHNHMNTYLSAYILDGDYNDEIAYFLSYAISYYHSAYGKYPWE